jgi:NitT/TauT family transport system ATP-binding protein
VTQTMDAHPSARSEARNALVATGVAKQYRTNKGTIDALTTTDLAIEPGKFTTIVGPSGCGKSTLLMILAGLLDASAGEVRYDGTLMRSPQEGIGVVFQSPALLPWLTVQQNTVLPYTLNRRRRDRRAHTERAGELLSMVGLAGFEKRYPTELSGGMQQRNAIARALLLDPPVLLMDEPFGALDALTRERMNRWLADIWQEQQKAVALVTHSIDEAVFLADEVVVMSPRPGRIVERVTVDLPRPRDISVMKQPAFGELCGHIRSILDDMEASAEGARFPND